jgi:hypothetical protein
VVGLDDAVQILRYVERKLLVVVHVNHRSVTERSIEPHAHRAIHVLAAAWGHVVSVFVTHHDADPYLVVSLIDDDLADALQAR